MWEEIFQALITEAQDEFDEEKMEKHFLTDCDRRGAVCESREHDRRNFKLLLEKYLQIKYFQNLISIPFILLKILLTLQDLF